MTGPKGLNGSGEPSNVTSLEEARKRASAKAKQEKRAARGSMSPRDWIIGIVVVAMALGMIGWWIAGLYGFVIRPR